jgi:glycosyltransferase involved in cell wall biosynthesis
MNQARPIKIMQVIARMNVGGPAVIVTELMRGLDPAKFQVVLMTGFCAGDEADYLDEAAQDIPVTRISGLGRSVSAIDDIKSLFTLIRLIREYKPDIIHTHTAKAGVLGRVAGLIACPSAKRVHTYHGHLLHGYFTARKTQIVIAIEKLLATFSAALIAIGNQVRDDLLAVRIGKVKKYSVIFPGLDKLDSQSKSSAKHELGLEQDKTYMVFVGRLTQIKRPDRLIEIARHLKVKHPLVELLIAGAGEKFVEIQELAKNESLPMVFLGWRNDIGRILSASNIALLCSDNEGIPLALIQASQVGLPIVSTNVGSVGDIVKDSETGILTEANSNSLIHAIDDLLSNPEKMARFGQGGKERAEVLFSWQGMINAHEDLYSQVIEKKD